MKEEETPSSYWSFEQDKAFENAVASHPQDCKERWDKIAAEVPGKTSEEVKHHYDLLLEDVNKIDSGCIPLPSYSSSSEAPSQTATEEGTRKKGGGGPSVVESNHGAKGSKSDQERRKGIAWTEEEHRLFLLGLDKYGKGDWRSISRNFVVTRTPTQVASHAQKYFIRLNSMNKDRKRTSIHDITNVGNGDVSASQAPITGHNTSSSSTSATGGLGTSSEKPAATPKLPAHLTTPGVGVFGTPTIGQPVWGQLVSALGTPVNLPVPPHHLAYGLRAPVPGTVVPGAPINMGSMVYPMPQPSSHI